MSKFFIGILQQLIQLHTSWFWIPNLWERIAKIKYQLVGLSNLSILVAIDKDIVRFVKSDFLTMSKIELESYFEDMIHRKSYTMLLALVAWIYPTTNKWFSAFTAVKPYTSGFFATFYIKWSTLIVTDAIADIPKCTANLYNGNAFAKFSINYTWRLNIR